MDIKKRTERNSAEQIRQQFIDATMINSKASADGDFRTANKQAKILKKIVQNMEDGVIDKNILVDLLSHNYVRVRGLAAIDLLRIGYATQKAEIVLEQVATMDESKMGVDEKLTVMAAKIQLKNWREKGYVTR